MNVRKKALPFLLAIALSLTHVGVTLAGDGAPPTLPPTPITVPMTLDCESLSGSALAYAVKHNFCQSGKGGGPQPQDVRYGDCGWSSLYIENLGTGTAAFHMAAGSSMGAIVNVNYNTNWTNWDKGISGSVSGSDWLFSTTWERTRVDYTQSGFVTATMSGVVTLWWGGTCGLLYPSDSEDITD
jgi:hypothetical protein